MQTASMRFHSTSEYSHQPRPAAVGWPDHPTNLQGQKTFHRGRWPQGDQTVPGNWQS
jgi:hypothetical protein